MNNSVSVRAARAQSRFDLDIIRGLLLVIAIAVASLSIGWPSAARAQTQSPPSLIVKLVAGLSASEQAAVVARNGGTEVSSVAALRLHVIQVDAAELDTVLNRYRADSQVQRAEVNKVRQSGAVPSDPLYSSQWSLPRIGWEQVFASAVPIGTATVAVLDTGIDATHPDLSGNVIAGTSILNGSNGMTDPSGHGTMVAGIVAARTNTSPANGIAGVGYSAVKLMPVTVLDAGGLGQDSDVIAGVVWATDHGADVILMAFSNPGFSESLQEAIDYAWSNNVLLVAAVGNDGANAASFPAGDRGVIGVSATDENDQLASFSNFGDSVFLAAPGTNIVSTELGGGYGATSGTSASAAIVAGAAAQLMAFDPMLSNGVVVGRLARTADAAGTQAQTGNGRINFARAYADMGTDFVQPAGAAPVGGGGPFVGPYRAAGNATISGTVRDTSNNPIAGAAVTCQSGCTGTANSAANGTYTINANFPANNATVSVTASATNFVSQTIGGISVSNTVNASNVNFNLAPKRATTTTVSCASPVIVGTSSLCTVTVTDTGASPTAPTGTVNLTAAGAGATPASTTCSLSGASSPTTCAASFTGSVTGTINVSASYAGDSTHATRSGNGSITVNAHTTTTSVSCSSPVVVGVASTCTVTVTDTSPGATAPTGTVALTASGAGAAPASTTCNLGGGGGASRTCTANFTGSATGTIDISASYPGDSAHAASSGSGSITVNARTTTTSVSCVPNSIAVGGSSTCTATVTDTSSGPTSTPTGTVSFNASGGGVTPATPTCTLSGSGPSANCSVALAAGAVGTISVAGSYQADSLHGASSGSASIDVKRGTSASLTCVTPIAVGASSLCTATVTDTSGTPTTPTGLVTITASGGAVSPTSTSCSLSGSGASSGCSITLTGNAQGTINVTAAYAGDSGHMPSSGIASIDVKRATTTSVSCNTPVNIAQPSSCTVTVTDNASGAVTPTGTFTVSASGAGVSPTSATCMLVGNGNHGDCTVSFTPSTSGTISVSAPYPGDSAHFASTGSATITVNSTITASAGANGTISPSGVVSVAPGASQTFTITANANYHVADVLVDGSSVGAVTTYTFSNVLANHTISASFAVSNSPPVASGQSTSTDEEQPVVITLAASDPDGNPLNFSLVGGPANGSLSVISVSSCSGIPSSCTATVTYTPGLHFNGADSFTFKANDGLLDSNVATVSITVNPVNDAPSFDPIANQTVDEDAGAQSVSITGVSPGPANESSQTVTISAVSSNTAIVPNPTVTGSGATRSLSYASVSDASGVVTITVTADDGQAVNNTFSRTFTITVNAVNDAPVAVGDSYSTDEDTPLVIGAPGVLNNDTDADGPSMTAILVSGPSHAASFTLNPNGSFSYTPAANYNGPDSFKYKVNDGSLDSNEATVNITVIAVNDAPQAVNDFYNTNEDIPLSVPAPGVLGNDNDIDTPPAQRSAILVSGPTHAASFMLNADGSFTYTPVSNYNGPDSFEYKVSDGTLESNVAMVTISVVAVNDVTVANNDAYETDEDTPLNVPAASGLLVNDDDPDIGEVLLVELVSLPSHASAFTLNPDGSFSYTPVANFNGSDTFTYQVNDQGRYSNTAMVTITIKAINDAPVAAGQSVATDEDAAKVITLSAKDIDSATLTFTVISGPANGSLSSQQEPATCTTVSGETTCTAQITYTPAPDYYGPDSFTFKANDGALDSNVATVSITVNPVNDAPTANADAKTTPEDTPLTFPATDLTANDNAGPGNESSQTLTVTAVTATANTHGTVGLASGNVTYTPATDFNGPASFSYTVCDDGTPVLCATGTVNVTVLPVNDPPSANGQSVTTPEDTALTLTLTGADVETASANLVYTITAGPQHGTLSPGTGPTRVYTPAPNYNGPDSFEFTVTDGGDPTGCGPPSYTCKAPLTSAAATVTIRVTPVNDPPTANAQSVTTNEDTAVGIVLTGNDLETGSNLTFVVTSGPAHGTLSGTAPNVTYTPNANYNGPDSFEFTVKDGGDPNNCGMPGDTCSAPQTSAAATISIVVRPVNDAPVANGNSVSTAEDAPLPITLSASDVETANPNLTFSIVTWPSHGTLSGTPPNVTYNPALNYNGADSFEFRVTDRGDPDNCSGPPASCAPPLQSSVATVNITVTPVNDPPADVTASVSPATITENEYATVSGSFTDPDIGDPHTVTINWGDGSPNTVLNLAAGVFTYSATHQYLDDNSSGADTNTIVVTVTDSAYASSSASASITVNNAPPVITGMVGPLDPIALGGDAMVTVTFTDKGSSDSHTCKFKWDDGTETSMPASGTGNGSCTATRKYDTSNVFEVEVFVEDDDGDRSASSWFRYVVIYDAKNGFVTGGGWINSPVGAYPANPSLTGKATFGFVSKYLKGSTVPTGDTEFDFHAGDFKFKSTSYEWLVISGAKARYHGFGTINGSGNYEFELVAWDGNLPGGGGVDRLRLRVWDQNRGNAMIYDNQPGAPDDADPSTALGGGSIVIHK